MIKTDEFQLGVHLPLLVLHLRPELPRGHQLVRADHPAEIEEAGRVATHLGPDAPDVVLVIVEKIEAAGVLIHWSIVVVAPQKVFSHLVTLMLSTRSWRREEDVLASAGRLWVPGVATQ